MSMRADARPLRPTMFQKGSNAFAEIFRRTLQSVGGNSAFDLFVQLIRRVSSEQFLHCTHRLWAVHQQTLRTCVGFSH